MNKYLPLEQESRDDMCATTKRTGTTLIPDKLKPVVSNAIYSLLQGVLSRYKHCEIGTSVFDVMTDDEYRLYMKLIDDAIERVRSKK